MTYKVRKFKNIFIVAFLVLAMFAVGCLGGDSYTRGTVTDDGFKSEFLNLKFTLPTGFHMLTEGTLPEEDGVYHEMAAMTPMAMPSVVVMSERVPTRTTVADYIEIFKENLLEELQNTPWVDSIEVAETVTVEFAGETYEQVIVVVSMFNTYVNQTYLIRRVDNMMVSIAFTYMSELEAELQLLMDAFESL